MDNFFGTANFDAKLARALEVDPRHPRSHYLLGLSRKERGDCEGAITAYEEAIRCYPSTDRYHLSETYTNLGTAHYESGDFEAATAVTYGLPFDDALASITLGAARILGVDDRVGSLEVGKDGDLALFDGDPFETTSHVCGVVIEGEVVSERCR